MIDPRKPHRPCLLGFAGLLACSSAYAVAPTPRCAHDAIELANILADVGNGGTANGHDNVVRLVAGTFTTNGGAFTFNSNSGFALTLEGGYDFNCINQDPTPGATVLDGGGPPPAGTPVLSLQSSGNIDVSRLTIRHGFRTGSDGGGASIYLANGSAVATFDDNQVLDNYSDYAVGGLTIFGSGTVHIDGNLFAGNSAPSAAAVLLSMDAGSVIYFNSNTVTGNIDTSAGSSIVALGGGSAGGYVADNISYGNTGTEDFYLYANGAYLFVDNDYASIGGTPTANSHGNLAVDPLFVDAANRNYRLAPNSPLRARGAASATGGLPAADLDGAIFPLKGKVDIGAWNEILFADGFDG